MIRGVLFDFDGVIVESAEVKTEAFRKLFEKEYPKYAEEIVDYHKGNMGISRYVKFQHIYERIIKQPYSREVEGKLGKRFSEFVVSAVLSAPFVAGAVGFLKRNHERYAMYVVSGTPETELAAIVDKRGIKSYFKDVYGSPRKKEEIAREILLRNHWKPDEVAFVGDAESDREASERCGVHFICRVNENGNFQSPVGRHSIRDLTELEGVLSQC